MTKHPGFDPGDPPLVVSLSKSWIQDPDDDDKEIEILDGTATRLEPTEPKGPPPERWRVAVTDNRGDPSGILKEMRARGKRMPWLSADHRRDAFDVVAELPLNARTRKALRKWIAGTGYCATPKIIIGFISDDGSPDFHRGRVARTGPAPHSNRLADLRLELAKGSPTVPFASKELRAETLKWLEIQEGVEGPQPGEHISLSRDERERLIRHIARAPYLTEEEPPRKHRRRAASTAGDS